MELSCSRFCSIANKLKGLSPVAVNFKLRKFKCKIAKKKKMKVKLTAEILYIFMKWKWWAGRNTKLSFVILSVGIYSLILIITDHCIILDPIRPLLQSFLNLLSSDLQLQDEGKTRSCGPTHIRQVYQVASNLTCSYSTFSLPRTRHLRHQTLSMSCWKLPWPALSTSSTGETKYFSLINNGTLAWFVCRHLEIIKPPLDVLLQEITQVSAVNHFSQIRIQPPTTWGVFWPSGKVFQSSKQAWRRWWRRWSRCLATMRTWYSSISPGYSVLTIMNTMTWHCFGMNCIFFKRNDIFTQSRERGDRSYRAGAYFRIIFESWL